MQQRVTIGLGHRVEVDAADTVGSPSTIPTSRAIAAAVSPWSPVTTMIRMPACLQRATASATSARGGSASAASPTKVRCDSTRSPLAVFDLGDLALREAEHPQPATRVALKCVAHVGPVGVGDRPVSFGGADRGAPFEQLERGPLGVVPELPARLLVERRHPLQVRVEVEHALATGLALALGARHVAIQLRRRDQQRALGRIAAAAPAVAVPLQTGVVAPHRGAQQAREQRRRPRSAPGVISARSRPPTGACTLMLPSVSVPVLSVQITSVEPSVSTAVRRLTSARRAAIRRTPPASDSVIVGNRPSGTFATSSPIANVTAAASDKPGQRRAGKEEHHAGADSDRRDQPRDLLPGAAAG